MVERPRARLAGLFVSFGMGRDLFERGMMKSISEVVKDGGGGRGQGFDEEGDAEGGVLRPLDSEGA